MADLSRLLPSTLAPRLLPGACPQVLDQDPRSASTPGSSPRRATPSRSRRQTRRMRRRQRQTAHPDHWGEQPNRTRAQENCRVPQGLTLRGQRRPRCERRRPPRAGCPGWTSPSLPEGLPPGSLPRPPALAPRPLSGARPQVLGPRNARLEARELAELGYFTVPPSTASRSVWSLDVRVSVVVTEDVWRRLGEPTQVDLACAKTGIEKPASVPRVDPAGRGRRSAGAQQVDLEGIEDPIHRAGRPKLHRSGQPSCSQYGQHVIERATQMTGGPARDSASALGKVPVHEQRERRLIHRRRWNPLESQPVREVACSNQVRPRDLRGVATFMQVISRRLPQPLANARIASVVTRLRSNVELDWKLSARPARRSRRKPVASGARRHHRSKRSQDKALSSSAWRVPTRLNLRQRSTGHDESR